MRSTLITASALLGSAAAGVHHMKLEKVPLDQQFAAASVKDHVRALGQKYSQKFMNAKTEDIFRDTSIHADGGFDVPVENFLNAQCKLRRYVSRSILKSLQTLPRLVWAHRHKISVAF